MARKSQVRNWWRRRSNEPVGSASPMSCGLDWEKEGGRRKNLLKVSRTSLEGREGGKREGERGETVGGMEAWNGEWVAAVFKSMSRDL